VLFQDFSSVAEKTGTYTAFDYADIMEHLVQRWKIADLGTNGIPLTGEAADAQQYLISMPNRVRKLAERAKVRKQQKKGQASPFAWVFDRPVELV
jgi:acyl-[acyl-carrier-protein] desaturase